MEFCSVHRPYFGGVFWGGLCTSQCWGIKTMWVWAWCSNSFITIECKLHRAVENAFSAQLGHTFLPVFLECNGGEPDCKLDAVQQVLRFALHRKTNRHPPANQPIPPSLPATIRVACYVSLTGRVPYLSMCHICIVATTSTQRKWPMFLLPEF